MNYSIVFPPPAPQKFAFIYSSSGWLKTLFK